MKPIGILGGTFDPVHHGHLRLAIECLERLDLQEVRLIPLHTPPHRNLPIANPEQRLAMLNLAVTGIRGLKVDDLELCRQSVSYTIDTLIALHKQNKDQSLCLLMGADAFNALHTWRRWNELLDYCHIVIAHRPGSSIHPEHKDLKNILTQHQTADINSLHTQFSGTVLEIEIPLLDISATQLRTLINEHLSPAALLPQSVIAYIQTHNLYGAPH